MSQLDLQDPFAVTLAAVKAFDQAGDARTVVKSLGDLLGTKTIETEVSLLASEIPNHDVLGRYRQVM